MSTELQRRLQRVYDNADYSRYRGSTACERFTLRVLLAIFELTWLSIVGLYCFSVSSLTLFATAAGIELLILGTFYAALESCF